MARGGNKGSGGIWWTKKLKTKQSKPDKKKQWIDRGGKFTSNI